VAAHLATRTLLDLLSDELARRSGILLSIGELRELGSHVEDAAFRDIILGELDDVVHRASDNYAEIARALRVAIGNLPDDESPTIRRMQTMQVLSAAGHDPLPALEAFARLAIEQPGRMIGKDECDEVMRRTGAPALVVNAAFLMLADHLDREASLFQMSTPRAWDGAIPLGQLFDTELIASDPDAYLDQRFLDYLAAREENLGRIHWPNFERLCAEFFRRAGFHVGLGPGRSDGGVDLRVWNAAGDPAPFLLVQCKRYEEGRVVSIEIVKALWSDVSFEGAGGGLIATTSRVAVGGKRVAEARGYPLTFAENARVRGWARSMWRFAYDGPTRAMVPSKPLDP